MAIKDLNEQERIELLATVGNSPVAMVILQELKEVYDKETEEVVKRGMICEEDFKRDFRYKLGQAAACSKLLERVNTAKESTKGT